MIKKLHNLSKLVVLLPQNSNEILQLLTMFYYSSNENQKMNTAYKLDKSHCVSLLLRVNLYAFMNRLESAAEKKKNEKLAFPQMPRCIERSQVRPTTHIGEIRRNAPSLRGVAPVACTATCAEVSELPSAERSAREVLRLIRRRRPRTPSTPRCTHTSDAARSRRRRRSRSRARRPVRGG